MFPPRVFLSWLVILFLGDIAAGLQPYEPEVSDPITERWRWTVFEESKNMGLRCVAEAPGRVMWFGSDEGIWRYDGYEWQHFGASTTGISGAVNAILVTDTGEVYAGCDEGLSRFREGVWERVFPSGSNLPFPINQLRVGPAGTIMAATPWGALFWHLETDRAHLFATEEVGAVARERLGPVRIVVPPPAALRAERPPSGVGLWGAWGEFLGTSRANADMVVLMVDENGPAHAAGIRPNDTIRLAKAQTVNPVELFNGPPGIVIEVEAASSSGSVRALQLPRESLDWEVGTFQISDLLVTPEGDLWFGHQQGTLTRFRPNGDFLNGRGEWQSWDERDGLRCGHSPRLLRRRNGELWAVSNDRIDGDLLIFDGADWTQFSLETLPDGSNNNTSIIETSDGSVLIGGFKLHCYRDGVWDVFTIREVPIPFHRTRLLEDSGKTLWVVGLGQHASRLDLGTERWESYLGLFFVSLLQAERVAFVSRENTVVVKDGSEWKEATQEHGLMPRVMRVLEAHDGTLWALGASEGKAATAFYDPDEGRWRTRVHPQVKLESPRANAIFEARDGALWFGAYEGVIRYQDGEYAYFFPPEAPSQVYSITQVSNGSLWFGGDRLSEFRDGQWSTLEEPRELNSWIECVAVDAFGDLVVGTRAYGIFRYKGDQWEQFTVADGLLDNNIHSIFPRPDGGLVIKTQAGLCRYESGRWFSMDLPVEGAAEPYQSSIALDGSGALWFNFDQHYVIAYRLEHDPPRTRIVRAPKEVGHDADVLVQWTGNDAWNATPADKLSYAYQVDGRPWSAYSRATQVSLDRLMPGEHVIRVRARDSDFNVDPHPVAHTFLVRSPFWSEPWFLGCVCFVVGVILLQAFRIFWSRRQLLQAHELLEDRVRDRTAELSRSVRRLAEEVQVRKRTEQELLDAMEKARAASQAKSEFLAVMGHEIRTPLNAILGFAQLLPETEDRAERDEFIRSILERGDHLLGLITDILEFTSLSTGGTQGQKTAIEPAPFLRRIVDSFQLQARGRGLELRFVTEGSMPERIYCEETRLTQIVSNLLGNALKFTREGSVEVRLASHRGHSEQYARLTIEVRDTGIGIPEEQRASVFEAFKQVDSSLQRAHEGVGLGLAITKRLVDLLDGTITCASEPGVGTTFTVGLECRTQPREGEREVVEATDAEEKPSGAPLRIIVAEDEPVNQRIFRLILQRKGFKVVNVDNGEELLERLRSETFDLVIMDVQMPVLDGLAATRRIREGAIGELNRNIPILGITAFATNEARDKCLAAGMNECLGKPVKMTELTREIHRQETAARAASRLDSDAPKALPDA